MELLKWPSLKLLAMQLEAWLTVCANAALLIVPDGGLRWQFAHDKLREGILLVLGENERRTYHQQIGTALEQVYAGNLSLYYPDLAYHYGQAALRPQERHYLQLAAETAQAAFANAAAIEYYARLLALLTDPLERSEALLHFSLHSLERRFSVPLFVVRSVFQIARRLEEPIDLPLQVFELLFCRGVRR